MSEATMNQTMYCAVVDLVDRMLVKANDVANYTAEMNYCIVEASRMVDTFLMPYVTTLPYVVSGGGKNIPDQIVIVSADFAASVFKRRYVPSEVKMKNLMPDMINDVDGSGWFALGLKKLLEFIKDNFALANNPSSSPNSQLFNPALMQQLYVKGILTLKEARSYIANPLQTIQEILNRVITENLSTTKTNVLTDTQTLSKSTTETSNKIAVDSLTRLHTERIYVTKKNNSVAFILGANNDEDTNQGGYVNGDNTE